MFDQDTIITIIGRRVVRRLIHTMLHIDVNQLGELPAGPKIYAPNHPTTLDPLVVGTLFSEPVHVLITESAFKVPIVRDYLRAEGHIPVVTGRGADAYQGALDLLRKGKNVAIFPEGALSPLDSTRKMEVGKLHTGTVRLALETGAPIIPLGIALNADALHFINTGVLDPYGKMEVARLITHGPYAITIGTPEYVYGNVQDQPFVRSLSARLEQQLAHLQWQSEQRVRKLLLAPVAPLEVVHSLN
ncbi:MAG: lysophospholipid acyltransferase family protein [Anaerolineae bacterium]|nr:1-acyl-sn-glycerol-3-phosphate acyltransferase [Anaerolineae bacterium]